MNVKVNEIMSGNVVTATPYDSIRDIRETMRANGIHAVPIVDSSDEPIGIITSNDFIREISGNTLVCEVMSMDVHTVPSYSDAHIVARIMRNHHINHVLVTEERRVVGIVSSFDLLRLVEEHRFAIKKPPTESSRRHPAPR